MLSSLPVSLLQFKDYIEKTDDDGVLQIYSYRYCNNESSDDLKMCRGLVYHGETPLFNSLGYTRELSDTVDPTTININFEESSVYSSEEGTLIRVFYSSVNNKWYISTHRKLNAFYSKWGCQVSFGEIFTRSLLPIFQDCVYENVIDRFTSTLEKSNIYFFFIRNIPENRIVCKAPEKYTVYHMGTLINGTEFSTNIDTIVPKLPKLEINTSEEAIEFVKKCDPFAQQGIIIFDKNGRQTKIINSKYQLYYQVRGNDPSVIFRYLTVRTHPTYSRFMYELYPEYNDWFVGYENTIFKIARDIHSAYLNRFVHKNKVIVPDEEYQIMRECHGWHISDRENNKVTLEVILFILSQPKFAMVLNSLMSKYFSNISNKNE